MKNTTLQALKELTMLVISVRSSMVLVLNVEEKTGLWLKFIDKTILVLSSNPLMLFYSLPLTESAAYPLPDKNIVNHSPTAEQDSHSW